eukprot:gene28447-37387_t
MATDKQNAQETQKIFQSAVDICMNGKLDSLQALISKATSQLKDFIPQDLFCEFNSEGKTVAHVAASKGHTHLLEYMIVHSNDTRRLVNVSDDRGFTPLMNATIGESESAMNLLINHGADANARNKDGASAIHFAAGDGSVPRMQLLCDAGANTTYKSSSGSILHWAAGKGRAAAIKFILEKIQLHESESESATSVENALAIVNSLSAEGIPPVIMAAVACCDLGVKYLVQAGADIGLLVSGNLTALHICAENGLDAAVQSIVETDTGRKCCQIETVDGNRPIHLAAMSGHRSTVELLLPMELTHTDVDVDALLLDGKQRLQAWNEKYSERNPAADAEVRVAEPVPQDKPTAAEEAEAEKLKDLGNDLFKKGAFKEAIVAYSRALTACRHSNAAYYSNRSACYMSVKDYEAALADAEACRRLRPTWAKGCYRLAVARLALNQFEDAALAAFEGCKLEESNKELKSLLQEAVKRGQEEHRQKQQQQQPGSSRS